MEATQRLIRSRTAFIIAHRVSTLENCDVLFTRFLLQGEFEGWEL
ncbi:MAG TPA: hypothetical protein VIR01_12875 [Pyrinomonadaceae bacterium]